MDQARCVSPLHVCRRCLSHRARVSRRRDGEEIEQGVKCSREFLRKLLRGIVMLFKLLGSRD